MIITESMETEKLVFAISLEELQQAAIEKLGRPLDDDEIQVAKKGLEFGLGTSIDVVYETIFFEMIEK